MADRTTEEAREAFEAQFSEAPYHFNMRRNGPRSMWPGHYTDYNVQCAWEGFQAALQWQAEQQKWEAASNAREVLAAGIVSHYGVPDDKAYECASKVLDLAASPHGVPPGYVLAAGGAAREADREAMRMALEAMKRMKGSRDFTRLPGYPLSDSDKKMDAAIKALEQRVGES